MGNTNKKCRYNWVHDLPDQRDYFMSNVPDGTYESVDLRPIVPVFFECGGSAGASTIANILSVYSSYGLKFEPSPWFVKNIIETKGVPISIRNVLKTLHKYGVCPSKYCLSSGEPTQEAFKNAEKIKFKYKRIYQNDILKVLSLDNIIICGMSIYESFDANNTITVPNKNEKVVGSETILILGYDLKNRSFIIKHGTYRWMTFENIKNCSNFWVMIFDNPKIQEKKPVVEAQKTVDEAPKSDPIEDVVDPIKNASKQEKLEMLDQLHNKNSKIRVEKVYEFKDEE